MSHLDLDRQKTALLTLDFQNGIVGFVPGADDAIAHAGRAVQAAREKGIRIIHVGLGFSEGHPEIPDTDTPFKRVKDNNLFVKGSTSGKFLASIGHVGDLVVYKQRVGAFSENELHLILRSLGIDTLVFFGLSTSGIVLSTLRRAFDLDYRSVVLKDACFDPEPEVHQILVDKVFPKQATVLTVNEFISGLA